MYGQKFSRKCPRAVSRLLLEYGGKTAHGLPRFRMVIAGDCQVVIQGTVLHRPKGMPGAPPERITGGEIAMPRYPRLPQDQWIFEAWFGPSAWGSSETWEEARAQSVNGVGVVGMESDTRLLRDPFPYAGQYLKVGGPWQEIAAAGDLRAAIRNFLLQERTRQVDFDAAMQTLMAEERRDREERLRLVEQQINRMAVEEDALFRSVSVEAQRWRDQLASMLGMSGEMLTASEAWG